MADEGTQYYRYFLVDVFDQLYPYIYRSLKNGENLEMFVFHEKEHDSMCYEPFLCKTSLEDKRIKADGETNLSFVEIEEKEANFITGCIIKFATLFERIEDEREKTTERVWKIQKHIIRAAEKIFEAKCIMQGSKKMKQPYAMLRTEDWFEEIKRLEEKEEV
jgi:hypothetical protein